MLLGDHRHRRAGITFAIVDSSSGARGRGSHEAGHRLRRRRQQEHAAGDGRQVVEPVVEPRHHAEVAAAAADRPEEVGLVLGIDRPQPAVRRDDVGTDEVVDRQPELPDQVPDPAAGRDPADPDRAGVAEPDRQAVLVRRPGNLDRGQAGARPRRLRARVDLDRVQLAEVDDEPAVDRPVAGAGMAAAPHGEGDAVVADECNRRRHVLRVGDADDRGRSRVDPAVDDGAGRVVVAVVGRDHAPADGVAQRRKVEGGSRRVGRGHRWASSGKRPSSQRSPDRSGAAAVGPSAFGSREDPLDARACWRSRPRAASASACRRGPPRRSARPRRVCGSAVGNVERLGRRGDGRIAAVRSRRRTSGGRAGC